MIVYETGVNEHPDNDGVTVIVATTGDVPKFMEGKDGTFPDPLTGIPIEGFELVHVKVAPGGTEEKLDAGTVLPLQYDVLAGTTMVGLETTVTVMEDEDEQPKGFVTVTVYVPDVETVIFCVVAPVDQL